MSFDQIDRLLRIDTTLGVDKALLTELEGVEAISRPFLFRITMQTMEPESKVRALLGEKVTLWIGANSDGDKRPIHGLIRRISRHHGAQSSAHTWQAEVVPALWFLSRKADCRIFQNVSVKTVLDKVLKLHGVEFLDDRANVTSPMMRHCVQYHETALDFVSRMMEENGICYWHEFEAQKHTLVLARENIKAPMMSPSTVTYHSTVSGEKLDWIARDFDYRTGTFASRDFNFKTPTNLMTQREPTALTVPRMADHEVFDYPGRHETAGRGKELAKLRIEAEEAHHSTLTGGGTTKAFRAGVRVNIEDGILDETKLYLITEVRHSARDTSGMIGGGANSDSRYRNEFSAIEASVPYRPLRVTPRPVVLGPQTATVTGPSGSEIHTDKWGRVKVRFHWDRNPDGSTDDNPSCWVRVSQGWAGKNWGMMHIPRVGHEVIVDFLEGDPDRPVITGRVYNSDNMPPWALPANKTQSGIKSNSSLGGGGSNEFRFEDEKGKEEVYFHAEKDLKSLIENNEIRDVGGKGTGDRTTTIKNNETLWVKGPLRKTTVDVDFEETVKGKETRTITGPIQETVTNNYKMEVTAGNLDITAATGINLTSPMVINITSGTAVNIVVPVEEQVTPFWGKKAATSTELIGAKFGVIGVDAKIAGIALSILALKIDLVGIKVDIAIATYKNVPIDLNKKVVELKEAAAAAIVRAAIRIILG